ncbi:MAG: PEP-CTERM sorting domain-containing protein [Verrucomicrobiota bacterium]
MVDVQELYKNRMERLPKTSSVVFCVFGLLFLTQYSASGGLIFSGGGPDPFQLEVTSPISFNLPGGVGISDDELVYFVFHEIYTTANPSLEQEDFSSTASVIPFGGGATFGPFSADVLDFDIGDITERDINFHWLSSGAVANGDTLTLGIGIIEIDNANPNIRVPDNLGSSITVGVTTEANGFFDLDTQTVSVIPEPTGVVLILLGVAGLGMRRRRAWREF